MPRLLLALLTTLLLAVAVAVAAAPAQARLPAIGVQDDRALLSPAECGGMLQVAQEGLKAGVVRLNVDPYARATAPRPGHWRTMAQYDAAIDCARNHRDTRGRLRPLSVMVTVGGFANGGGARYLGRPNFEKWFVGRVAALRKRWPQVAYWSFFNEPNIHTAPAPPCAYARIYRAASRAVLDTPVEGTDVAVRPRILLGELAALDAAQYLRRVFRCRGAGLVADGVSVHAFQFRTSPEHVPDWSRSGSIGNLGRLHSYLSRYRSRLHTRAGKVPEFFITEFGYITPGSMRGGWVVPERTAAKWWPRVIKLVSRPAWHVRMLMPYMITAHPKRTAWSTSLMRRDGSARPALGALVKALGGKLPRWLR